MVLKHHAESCVFFKKKKKIWWKRVCRMFHFAHVLVTHFCLSLKESFLSQCICPHSWKRGWWQLWEPENKSEFACPKTKNMSWKLLKCSVVPRGTRVSTWFSISSSLQPTFSPLHVHMTTLIISGRDAEAVVSFHGFLFYQHELAFERERAMGGQSHEDDSPCGSIVWSSTVHRTLLH